MCLCIMHTYFTNINEIKLRIFFVYQTFRAKVIANLVIYLMFITQNHDLSVNSKNKRYIYRDINVES